MACSPGQGGISLGIPNWYDGLPCKGDSPGLNRLADVWIIAGNIVDILLFIAGVVAVFYIIYSGIKYITSQGQPDKMTQAKQGLTYAIVGLVVSITARVLVQYISNQFSAGVVVG